MRSRLRWPKQASSPPINDTTSPLETIVASSSNCTVESNNKEHEETKPNPKPSLLKVPALFQSVTLFRCFYLVSIIWFMVFIVYLVVSNIPIVKTICNSTNSSSSFYNPKHIKADSFQKTRQRVHDNLNVTIFYSISIPAESSNPSLSSVYNDDTMTKIQEQIQFYKNSKILKPNVNSHLYYSITPNTNKKLNNDIINFLNEVNGKEIDTKKETNVETITLSFLYNHCRSHPHTKVIYMHNIKDISLILLRMSTMSVFTNECLLMDEEDDTTNPLSCKCNICSGRFSPIPTYHTPGNIWIAQCSYINQLLPPNDFENAMDFTIQTIKSNALSFTQPQTQFINNKSNAIYLGTKQYSIHHWSYSHPAICPCDVYPGLYRWGSFSNSKQRDHLQDTINWKPVLKKGPRFPEINDYVIYRRNYISNKKNGNVIPTYGDIFNQMWYYGLSGRIRVWKLLYGMIPDDRSWIWDYYNNSIDFK